MTPGRAPKPSMARQTKLRFDEQKNRKTATRGTVTKPTPCMLKVKTTLWTDDGLFVFLSWLSWGCSGYSNCPWLWSPWSLSCLPSSALITAASGYTPPHPIPKMNLQAANHMKIASAEESLPIPVNALAKLATICKAITNRRAPIRPNQESPSAPPTSWPKIIPASNEDATTAVSSSVLPECSSFNIGKTSEILTTL